MQPSRKIKPYSLAVVFFVGLLTLFLISSCSERQWVQVSIGDSRVRALFPWTPKIKSKTLTLNTVGDALVTSYSLTMDNVYYSVTVVKTKDEDVIFNLNDLSPRSKIKKGAKLTRTKTIAVDGVEGKEFVLKKKIRRNRTRKIKQRMFVDSNQLYTVIVTYRRADRLKARKFLKSVRFTKRAAK